MNTLEGTTRASVLDIKGRVLASFQDLNTWWKHWLQNNLESCREVPTESDNTFTRDASGIVFSTLLQYDGLRTAYTLCTYDATRILLLQILQRILQAERQALSSTSYNNAAESILEEDPNSKQTPLLGISLNIEGLAHEILRSIDYIHSQTHQFMTSFANFYLLDIAYSALDARSREARWFLSRISLLRSPGREKRPAVGSIEVLPSCRLAQTMLPSCRFHQKSIE